MVGWETLHEHGLNWVQEIRQKFRFKIYPLHFNPTVWSNSVAYFRHLHVWLFAENEYFFNEFLVIVWLDIEVLWHKLCILMRIVLNMSTHVQTRNRATFWTKSVVAMQQFGRISKSRECLGKAADSILLKFSWRSFRKSMK